MRPPRCWALPARWPSPPTRAQAGRPESFDVGRIDADEVGDAAGQNVAENSEAGAQHGFRLELPGDRGSRLQNRQRRGGKHIAEMGLDGGVQRLIHIVRDGIERAAKARDLIVRIERIGIERVAHAESPGQLRGHLPGVLRVEIEIEEVEWLVGRQGKSLRRRGCHSIDKLRQRRVGHRRNRAFAEIVVIQAEDSGVRAKPKFVSAMAPGEIVVDEEPRGAPALHPGVVEPSERGEGRIGAAALQHDRKCGERLLEVAGPKQAFVPGKRRIEIIHQVLRKDVRVSRREGIERLRRDRIEQRVDRIRVGGLHAGVGLKAKPGRVFLVDVVVDADGLHLLVIVAGMRNALAVGATVSIRRIARRRGCRPS